MGWDENGREWDADGTETERGRNGNGKSVLIWIPSLNKADSLETFLKFSRYLCSRQTPPCLWFASWDIIINYSSAPQTAVSSNLDKSLKLFDNIRIWCDLSLPHIRYLFDVKAC